MTEFDIIRTYFDWHSNDTSIVVANGDDCAVISSSTPLAVSTDTLNEHIHFFADTKVKHIAHKALLVNLSDLAAMGATPKYFTLNLSLPTINHQWLTEFSTTLKFLSDTYGISLIGGDTTKGALSITLTVFGTVKTPLRRSGAQVGDGVFVSGTLGGAHLALEYIQQNRSLSPQLYNAFHTPTACIELGQKLLDIATSCIDISDGLAGDLGHILSASKVGADIWEKAIPLCNKHTKLSHALYGGEDYELCFTAPIDTITHRVDIANITQIGIINASGILTLDGNPILAKSFEHF